MKIKKIIPLWISLVGLFFLTGCWDAKEIQSINYITALGIDYEKGKYVVYAQMLDFTSVAKQEGGKPTDPAQVWVSKTAGVSVNEALNKLYQIAQQHVYYSHISAIVYSDAVLRHGPEVVFDMTNRYREIRYTKWAFSSRESLEKLLSTTPFFNESPLSSILHEPKATYRQSSYITPLQFQRFVSHYFEKGKTAYLPTLSMNSSVWKDNLKKHTLLEVDGSIFMDHRGKFRGFLSRGNLVGLRWVNPRTIRTPLFISENGKIVATLVFRNPQVRIEPVLAANKLSFQIHLRLKGNVNELGQTIKEATLKKMAQERIVKEIKDTYETALKKQIDVYELGYHLYLHDPAKWKTYFGSENAFPLDSDSLQPIDIQLTIQNTGKYHLRK